MYSIILLDLSTDKYHFMIIVSNKYKLKTFPLFPVSKLQSVQLILISINK